MSQGPLSATAITAIQTTISSTGAVNSGNLDISGITGDWTIKVEIQSLTSATGTPTLTLQIEDSVNAFTAVIAQHVKQFKGPINPNGTAGSGSIYYEIRKYDCPNMRFGTSSAVARLNATVLGGGTPSCILAAWVEY